MFKNINIFFFIFFIFFIILFTFISIYLGSVASSDTLDYWEWSKQINEGNFEFLINNRLIAVRIITHLIPILYISLLEKIFLDNWQFIFLLTNLSIFFFLFYLIFITLRKEIKIYFTYAFLFVIYFSNFEQYLWTRYILTEYFFLLVSNSILYFMIKYEIYKNIKYLILILSLFIVSIFVRPVFIVFLIFFPISLYFYFFKRFFSKTKLILLFLLLLSASLYLLFFIILKYELETLFLGEILIRLKELYSDGKIVSYRYHTYMDIEILNLSILFKLFVHKIIYFFVFWDVLYSFNHNLINFFVFIPTYFFGLIAILYFNSLSSNQKIITKNCSILIFSYVFFHSITCIDFDWRMRLPIYLPLIIISIIGFEKSIKLLFYRSGHTNSNGPFF